MIHLASLNTIDGFKKLLRHGKKVLEPVRRCMENNDTQAESYEALLKCKIPINRYKHVEFYLGSRQEIAIFQSCPTLLGN